MKVTGRSNRHVDFTVVGIEDGGASITHFQKQDVMAAFEKEGWTNDTARLREWLDASEPGDMTTFQSGWIFRRIPK